MRATHTNQYDVRISVERGLDPLTGKMLDAASETVTVEADREGLAKTKAMMKTTIRPNGRLVSYAVEKV